MRVCAVQSRGGRLRSRRNLGVTLVFYHLVLDLGFFKGTL